MKVAVVYNRESQRVINLFGLPNREKYGLKNIQRILDALKKGGHQAQAFEGDKDLIDRLEEFMPRVLKHERPGMVFNLSYGIQGQARYTHVPGMLEMIGLPYVGSGPLAHSLALDKVVSKMIFVQNGIPTPEFAVLNEPGFELPPLKFPLITKPKNEAVSFGIKIVRSEAELREAAQVIFDEFQQPVLVERYIAGREINVGLLGNRPVEVLPPAEIKFGNKGPKIYTREDKTRKSGREISVECPAQLTAEQTAQAQEIAKRAFEVLGCYDCARVDLRLDRQGNFYVLEVNSLPSLGMHGSYVEGAAAVGLDFTELVNRLVDTAAARYFGTPQPPNVTPSASDPSQGIAAYLTARRDEMERQVRHWTRIRSRTQDPLGLDSLWTPLHDRMGEFGLRVLPELSDQRWVQTWQTEGGLEGGTLLVFQGDVPLNPDVSVPTFRREPEWLFGEGVGTSRAPLVSLLFALRALRRIRKLRKLKLGVLCYGDEGHDARFSRQWIQSAAKLAREVLILNQGNMPHNVVTARRGQRRYRITVEGEAIRLGRRSRKPHALTTAFELLKQSEQLSSQAERVSVATMDIRSSHMPMLLPHHVQASLLVSYPDDTTGNQLDEQLRALFATRGLQTSVKLESERPAMRERRASKRVLKDLTAVAEQWDIPLKSESSIWPSIAGLVPASTGVICGLGPVAKNIYTPDECVDRISLVQRTLLLAEFLVMRADS